MSAVNPSSHPAHSLEEVLRGWLPSACWNMSMRVSQARSWNDMSPC